MKRSEKIWEQLAANDAPHFWEESWEIPSSRVDRSEIEPVLERMFLSGWASWCRGIYREYWFGRKQAFAELIQLQPEGMEALARFCACHLRKRLPASGITEAVFWDEFILLFLSADHGHLEDETLQAYVRDRIGKPGWAEFLRRFSRILDTKETPGLEERLRFCMWWDLFPMPLRYWSDSAVVELFNAHGVACNLDKVRNLRRELKLGRSKQPLIVKEYFCNQSFGHSGKREIQMKIDDHVAMECGLSATLSAFLRYMEAPQTQPGS